MCIRDRPEKDLVLGLSNKSDADRLLHALGREMEFYKPGHGIAFTLSPVSYTHLDVYKRQIIVWGGRRHVLCGIPVLCNL